MRSLRGTRSARARPSFESRQQLVDALLCFRVGLRLVVGAASPSPAPRAKADEHRADDDPAKRQPPHEEVEALTRWGRKDHGPPVSDQLGFDLLLRLAARNADGDERFDL